MTLTQALANANTGLSAASYRANIASNNIANANSPGYVRRTVDVAENVVGGAGAGVRVVGVSRAQNMALTIERRLAEASANRADIVSKSYTELNRNLGEPDDAASLFAAYQNFESTMRELSLSPESVALQNSLYVAADQLTARFNTLSDVAQRQREDADAAIATAVSEINNALTEISEINKEIGGFAEGSNEAATLEDRRQILLDTISQYMPVRQIPAGKGAINVISTEGTYLLVGDVRPISFTQSSAFPPDATYNNGAGILSGLTVDGQDITPGSSSTFAGQSGLLAGYFAVRDEIAPDFLNQLDTLAADLIDRFSNDALDPTKTPGEPGLFTDNGNAFDPANLNGVARRLSLNAAIDPEQGGLVSRFRDGLGAVTEGPAGNADILNGLLDAFTERRPAPAGLGLTGTLSTSESVAGFTSLIGEQRIRSDAVRSSAVTRAEIITDAEISESAVDTDQELQSLLLIEQAYAANARVIQTVRDMINRLLEI